MIPAWTTSECLSHKLLGRIVALWYANGDPKAALLVLEALAKTHCECLQYAPFYVTQGHLLEALHLTERAKVAYTHALDLSGNSADKKVLIRKINLL